MLDSAASVVLVWRFRTERHDPVAAEHLERRAQAWVALTMIVVAFYVGVQSIRALIDGSHPEASAFGLILATASLVVVPWLARLKLRVASRLASRRAARRWCPHRGVGCPGGGCAGGLDRERRFCLVVGRSSSCPADRHCARDRGNAHRRAPPVRLDPPGAFSFVDAKVCVLELHADEIVFVDDFRAVA